MSKVRVPSYLRKDGKKVFKDIVAYLQEHDKFKDIDVLLVEQFAVAYESYRRNYELIKEQGEVLFSDKGNAYINPAKNALAQAVNSMQTLAKSLGIGEYNRKLAGFGAVKEEDDFDNFLFKGE
jgi:P27 family predicted phage terminase small subunit